MNMKWTSLVLSSAVAIAAPGEASAFKPQETLALKPPGNQIAAAPPAAAKASQSAAADPSVELQTLEKRFFMHDFSRETMAERLTRMEKFTLGETQTGSVQSRVAKLASILDTHSSDTPLHTIQGVNPATKVASSAAPKAPAPVAPPRPQSDDEDTTSEYPHITFLEDNILGQDFPGQPVTQRLARLETKAFGAPSSDPDLSNRTDALERYAEVKLHKRPFEIVQAPEGPDFGDLMPPEGRPPRIVRNDAEAAAPSPPPDGARLLSRVAWCEMHTLGRTYPEMHLLPRLHQLNAKLFPNDKTKDIQLMDHVDQIVKEVVLRQHPPTTQTSYNQ